MTRRDQAMGMWKPIPHSDWKGSGDFWRLSGSIRDCTVRYYPRHVDGPRFYWSVSWSDYYESHEDCGGNELTLEAAQLAAEAAFVDLLKKEIEWMT